jgi:hypothetical protein
MATLKYDSTIDGVAVALDLGGEPGAIFASSCISRRS